MYPFVFVSAAGAPGQWRSRMTFVLALAAAVVGLGNLWRFSYLTGEHGGGAFVLLYVLCLFLLGVPVLIAEVALGSYGRASPLIAVREAADRSLRSRAWMCLVALASGAALAVLSLYAVVAGWSLAFANNLRRGEFASASVVDVADFFDALLLDLPVQVYWLSVFLLVAMAVVWAGARRGLGTLAWLAVPVLIALLGVLVRFALEHGDLAATRDFLFSVQLLDFNWQSLGAAMGHAFYTVGAGAAVGICYGAYAPERIPIGRAVIAVALFDTLVSIAVGLAIFPVLFAQHVAPASGPGLMFIAVPYAFGNSAAGELFGALFFLMVVVAALGTAVALLEAVVSSLVQWLGLRRFTAVLLAGAGCWLLALLAVESLGTTSPGAANLLVRLDHWAAGVLLPLAALLGCVFVGWRMRSPLLRARLYRESDGFFSLWYALIRYIAPPAIVLVLAAALWSDWSRLN
nr:sodium-dependent transporter [Parahaliea mediterranea]